MTITALPTPPSRSAPSTFSNLADAFLAALPTFATEANALAVAMNLNATTATSVTSLAIGTGTKNLTVDTAKSYQPGMSVKIAYTTDPTNWMHGDVVSYDTGTGALVVSVTAVQGSGTQTAWTVTLSGPAGIDIPVGTKMLFYADTAPTGWTIDNTLDDKVVFVTKGSAAGGQTGGGAHSAGTWTQPGHQHAHAAFTLTANEIPAHTHDQHNHATTLGNSGGTDTGVKSGTYASGSTGGGASHTHPNAAAAATANTWRPAAYAMIICSKN